MRTLLFAVMLAVLSSPIFAQVSPLTVKDSKIIDVRGKAVDLYGISFSWHNWWGQYYVPNMVAQLKNDWHCNLIRASIGVAQSNDYIENPAYAQKCIDNVVKEAIKQNMYVVIDFHSHVLREKEAIKFFTTQAKKYGDSPNVIFELFNEPVNQPWPVLKEYAEVVGKAIRKYSKNIILMGTPQWDQCIMEAANNPVEGVDNLMYTFHFYANSHREELRTQLEIALEVGVPVFISECGAMGADGGGVINEREFNLWAELAEKNHVPMVLWAISDKDEMCSILRPGTSPEKKLDDSDLTGWGLFCKQFCLDRFAKLNK